MVEGWAGGSLEWRGRRYIGKKTRHGRVTVVAERRNGKRLWKSRDKRGLEWKELLAGSAGVEMSVRTEFSKIVGVGLSSLNC